MTEDDMDVQEQPKRSKGQQGKDYTKAAGRFAKMVVKNPIGASVIVLKGAVEIRERMNAELDGAGDVFFQVMGDFVPFVSGL